MSRDQHRFADPEPRPPGHDPRRLGPMSPGPLVVTGVVALVAGWALHRLADRWWDTTLTVSWGQIGALWFLAAVLAATAWTTARDTAGERRLQPHQSVNRLVLARACAVVGALAAGGYTGFGIGWINNSADDLLAGRLLSAAAAALAGWVTLLASVALERACRARSDRPDV